MMEVLAAMSGEGQAFLAVCVFFLVGMGVALCVVVSLENRQDTPSQDAPSQDNTAEGRSAQLEELRTLERLRETKVLTEEEFQAARQRVQLEELSTLERLRETKVLTEEELQAAKQRVIARA